MLIPFKVILFLFSSLQIIYCLDGPHVCQHQIEEAKAIKVPTKVPVEVTTFKWCAKWPPRCQTTRVEYRDSYQTKVVYELVNKTVCCSGYVEYNGRCIPVCSDQCIHGICVEPNKCDCESGWAGDTCNILDPCPDGRKGNNCSDFCNCKNGAKCDPVTGECLCKPGWSNKDCSKPCSKGFYGFECSQKCLCQNGGNCHHITGECICPAGFKGKFCENECGLNELDADCNHRCSCENDGGCNVFTGECTCKPGYTGSQCEHSCPPGTYGKDCSQICNCSLNDCDNEEGCKLSPIISIQPALSYSHTHQEGNIAYNSILLTISCLLILILCCALLTLIRYHRRVKALSKERAYVTYVANKDPTDQFENPVYSYAPCSVETKLHPPLTISKSYAFPNCNNKNDLSLCKNNREKTLFPGSIRNNFNPYQSHSVNYQQSSSSSPSSSVLDQGCSSDCKLNICNSASNSLYANQEYNLSTSSLYKEPIYAEIKGKDYEDDQPILDHYDRPRPLNKILNSSHESSNTGNEDPSNDHSK